MMEVALQISVIGIATIGYPLGGKMQCIWIFASLHVKKHLLQVD